MNLVSKLLLASILPLGAPAAIQAAASATPEQATTVTETRIDIVNGHCTTVWTLDLPADELTHIVVDGDGSSDLDVFLIDENGNIVDSDTDATDYCIVDVIPLWSGEFTLEIRNLGWRANLYELRVD